MNPHISILILNWNGKDLIQNCLDSILKINYKNYSVFVIDNNSTDNSIKLIENKYPQVEVIPLNENYGFAGGYNRAFKKLKNYATDFILLLNNDTEVDKQILVNFVNAKTKYGDDNIYGGKIYYHDQKNKIWFAGSKIKLEKLKIYHIGIRELDADKFSNPQKTDYITGCCLFTSFEVIKKLDGFDEQFNMYSEDVDFCLRARNKDIYCYYWPEAKLWHHVSASLGGEFSLKKNIKKFISLWKLLKKYYFK